jgi:hypothetical protein
MKEIQRFLPGNNLKEFTSFYLNFYFFFNFIELHFTTIKYEMDGEET